MLYKYPAFCFILIFNHLEIKAQNLILNSGLENYQSCPGFGQFGSSWVTDWHKPSAGSSDYYHYNCPGIIPGPNSAPRTGNGEAGIILYNFGTEYREYVTASISQPLTAGQSYYLEFYLALNPGYIQAVKEAGAYFSDSVPGFFPNALTINVTPQVQHAGGFLSYGWNKISGNFTANGGENYITFGNFKNDSNTTTMQVGTTGSYGSYYFIDDVYLASGDSVQPAAEPDPLPDVRVFPNPVKEGNLVTVRRAGGGKADFSLFSTMGQLMLTEILVELNHPVKLAGLQPGLYFYVIRKEEEIICWNKLMIE